VNTTSLLIVVVLAVVALVAIAFAVGFVILVIKLSQRRGPAAQAPGDGAEAPSLAARLAEIEDAYQHGLISEEERAEARRAALAGQ
jgi:flagellar biosynthesis/type III secretory pathway M-ring protein FliF/YscJ